MGNNLLESQKYCQSNAKNTSVISAIADGPGEFVGCNLLLSRRLTTRGGFRVSQVSRDD